MIRAIAIFLLAVVALSSPAWGYVRVTKDPPVIEHKTFDPANPPADMPHLEPNVAAVTVSDFHLKAKADYEVVSSKPGPDGVTSIISVHGVTISTQLHVVIWAPTNASDKLKAHEEGHRKLHEKIYTDLALAAARTAGKLVDGKRFTGDGPDWKTAAQNAVNKPVNDMYERYIEMTSKRSSDINDAYDAITGHGLNPISEDAAMAQALAQYEKDHPTTQPTKPPAAK
jgi:hypothetical protein